MADTIKKLKEMLGEYFEEVEMVKKRFKLSKEKIYFENIEHVERNEEKQEVFLYRERYIEGITFLKATIEWEEPNWLVEDGSSISKSKYWNLEVIETDNGDIYLFIDVVLESRWGYRTEYDEEDEEGNIETFVEWYEDSRTLIINKAIKIENIEEVKKILEYIDKMIDLFLYKFEEFDVCALFDVFYS